MRKSSVFIDEKVGVEFIDLKRMNIDKFHLSDGQLSLLEESVDDGSQLFQHDDSINVSDLRETRNSSTMMRDKEREYMELLLKR